VQEQATRLDLFNVSFFFVGTDYYSTLISVAVFIYKKNWFAAPDLFVKHDRLG